MTSQEIAAFVLSRPPVDGLRLVGVDGPSGAGKSTIARRLAERLAAPIVELDDFVSWNCFAAWWPRFEEQVLFPLEHGSDAVYQARDWTADWYGSSLGPWKTVPWHPIVIVEGVTATRRATVGRLAGAIWVDAPADLRLSRGLTRDAAFPGAPALWQRWMAEETRFFTADDTRSRADFVIDTAAQP